MKEPKDKRTKAYKEWKKKFDAANENKSEGLGDTIEKITEATGIKKAVKFLAGEDCGCDERKKILNDMFRYNKPLCLNEEEYNFLTDVFTTKGSIISASRVVRCVNIFNRIFNAKQKATSCSSCFVANVYNPLKKVYEAYK